MDVNNLQVNTNIVGGYFSSEQIDLLSIYNVMIVMN